MIETWRNYGEFYVTIAIKTMKNVVYLLQFNLFLTTFPVER